MTTPDKNKGPAAMKAEIITIFGVMDEFSALLEKETAALEKVDFQVVDTLQADKRRLATAYSNHVTGLVAHKDSAAQLDSATREALIKKRTAFTKTLGRNLRALEAAKSSTRRLIDRILDTAQKAAIDSKQTHYSAKGQTASWKSAAMSLSMDQKL